MLPVNGRDWFREQQGLSATCTRQKPRCWRRNSRQQVIAGHNDLVPANTIPMGNIAQGFSDYAPGQPYKILQPGELYLFAKG